MAGFLTFEPLPSEEPGVPDFVVRIPTSRIRGGEMPIPGVTTYSTMPKWFTTQARNNESWTKDYVYVYDQFGGGKADADGSGIWEFYFTKNRGEDLFRNPITFRTENTTKPHQWYDVILRMGFLEDPNQAVSYTIAGGNTISVPRLFERYWQLPGGVYATKMKVEVFLNHEAFPEDMFLLDTPVPTTVSWDLRNASGSLRCLHPKIQFVEDLISARTLLNNGTVNSPIQARQIQEFPATNHPTWIEHVADEDVATVRGVRRMVRTTVYPPSIKRITNAAG